MPRFFVGAGSVRNGLIAITGSDADHIRVLRMKRGEAFTVCDGAGTDYLCRLGDTGTGFANAEILEAVPSPGEPTVACTVLAGIPKGERADYLVQKCVEAGAGEIVFFHSDRCVAVPEAKAMPKKLERWQRIAMEAAKQSGRGRIPTVRWLDTFVEAMDEAVHTDLPLFLYETGEARRPVRDVLTEAGDFASCALVTGPEGGFAPFEADLAQKLGLRLCSMGPRILRCETAPVVAVTAVMYATGNL